MSSPEIAVPRLDGNNKVYADNMPDTYATKQYVDTALEGVGGGPATSLDFNNLQNRPGLDMPVKAFNDQDVARPSQAGPDDFIHWLKPNPPTEGGVYARVGDGWDEIITS